jgi:hypothetical protein
VSLSERGLKPILFYASGALAAGILLPAAGMANKKARTVS